MVLDTERQKSLKRRFLLILGVAVFICCLSLGLMIIFWDSMVPSMPKLEKIGVGVLIIIYGVIRFSRLLRKSPDEI
jgi:CHASE2 domain-containing sensor protein